MKVYQFNMDNGFYAGELFEDEAQLKYVEGVTPVPPMTAVMSRFLTGTPGPGA